MYKTIQTGPLNTLDFKLYILKNDKIISPWHDISYMNGPYITCINEIPRFSNAKLEINKKLPSNPITQDIKKGKLRYVSNIFPFNGYPWNYGAIPQTWENPHKLEKHSLVNGDNDPLDVIDIGNSIKQIGEVYEAKVLGCLVLIDEGECDYKIIVIDRNCNMADKMNNIGDVEKCCPGLLEVTREWFRDYKLPDGKKQNVFAFDGEFKDNNFTMEVIKESHDNYNLMMRDKNEDFSYDAVKQEVTEFKGNNEKKPKDADYFSYIVKK